MCVCGVLKWRTRNGSGYTYTVTGEKKARERCDDGGRGAFMCNETCYNDDGVLKGHTR